MLSPESKPKLTNSSQGLPQCPEDADLRELAAPTREQLIAFPRQEKFSQHFEHRPEYVFRSLFPKVYDASIVRERSVADLRVVRIDDIFSGKNEVFIGFGRPNTYLVTPDENGGYQKFAGKSFYRAPSIIEPTKNWIQSGVLFRINSLPDEAIAEIQRAMKVHDGKKYATCVNVTCKILEDAGFRLENSRLSSIYTPHNLFHKLKREELIWKDSPVTFDVIRTTPRALETYFLDILYAESSTIGRHLARSAEPFLKKYGLGWIILKDQLDERASRKAIVAPPLAPGDYENNIQVRLSSPTHAATLLRLQLGAHIYYEVTQNNANVADFLPDALAPFPQENKSFFTRLKQTVLFSRPVVSAIRSIWAPEFIPLGARNERDVYDMLRTSTSDTPEKYNIVITGKHIALARIDVKYDPVDWIMSKHVLVSGYDRDVRFAGELWKDPSGLINLTRNSGTYMPSEAQHLKATDFLQAAFPKLSFKVAEIPQKPGNAKPK